MIVPALWKQHQALNHAMSLWPPARGSRRLVRAGAEELERSIPIRRNAPPALGRDSRRMFRAAVVELEPSFQPRPQASPPLVHPSTPRPVRPAFSKILNLI